LPPTLDFRQLAFGPFRDDLTPPEVNLSAIPVDRNPFTLRHRGACELRPAAREAAACKTLKHLHPIVGRQTLRDEGWQQNVGFPESLDDLGFHVGHLQAGRY
jgi:hypothetical protein